jgi:hypothetical protein
MRGHVAPRVHCVMKWAAKLFAEALAQLCTAPRPTLLGLDCDLPQRTILYLLLGDVGALRPAGDESRHSLGCDAAGPYGVEPASLLQALYASFV